jgi:FtsH-binding integral membrane protein
MYDSSPALAQQRLGVAHQGVDVRAAFLQKTYAHLLGAIVAFTLYEYALIQSGVAEKILAVLGSAPWLVWLGAWMLISFLATRFAFAADSLAKQYVGLTLYVAGLGIIFLPLLYIAQAYYPGAIGNAALATLAGFSALTAIVFVTRKDFSFLRGVLMFGTIGALGFIVAGALFGFSGGVIFPILMVVLMGGWILYDTSSILLHYPEDRYVGAALSLFASVAMAFYYVLMLFMGSRD